MNKGADAGATIKLTDGRHLPMIGFGTYGLEEGREAKTAVGHALDAGYRHIDTARFYNNEASVGAAVRKHATKRKDIWVTTKLWPMDFVNPEAAIEKSLEKLDIGYIDLYLIHWPTPVEFPGFDKKLWQKMESFKEQSLCKSIGVSNFKPKRLQKIISSANIPPVVNQVHCSPFHYPEELHQFCKQNSIEIVGYYPLAQGKRFDQPVLTELAKKHQKTPAQIMLRWALQKGVIPIPKSRSKPRILENFSVFDFKLETKDMSKLKALNKIK